MGFWLSQPEYFYRLRLVPEKSENQSPGPAQSTSKRMTYRIINADCLKAIKELPDESIDLTVFSPPYDGIRDYHGDWALDFPELGREIFRVTRDGRFCAIIIGDGTKNFRKSMTSFKIAVNWTDNGWNLFETCIYSRDGRPGAWWKKRFRVDHEYIFLFFKGDRPRDLNKDHLRVPTKHAGKLFQGTNRLTDGSMASIPTREVNKTKCRGTIWNYSTSNTEGNPLKMRHPATFPDKLAEDLIVCLSDPDETVLDPMCGSGTTCVMAAKSKRHVIGIDVSEEYCEIARERLRNETLARPSG